MEKIVFHHCLPVQIRFNDVDKFGHVNNTVYFQYYDTAKTDYVAQVCPDVDWEKEAIMVVHIESDFLSQISAADKVAVRTAVSRIGHKSFTLIQEVFDTDTQEIKCTCKSVMVAYNLEKKESMLLPEKWVEAIRRYEGNGI
jgi:acyl-CoA thioester hydrolase